MTRWIGRAVVSGIVLLVLVALMPLGAVIDALTRVSPAIWIASLAIFFAGHTANALKLQLLLGPAAPRARVMLQAQYAGLAANLALPGLAGGDVVRAGYLAPATGLSRVAIASLADRLIDTATLVGLMVLALPWAGMPAPVAALIGPAGWWLLGLTLGGAILLVIAIRLLGRTRAARGVRDAWQDLAARPASLAAAVVLSLGVQALFVVTNVWLARAAGVEVGLAAWFVAWPLAKLIAVLPISLGGLGVREAVLVSLLTPYGADGTAVLASGLLWQGVLAVSGLLGLAVTQLTRRQERTSGVFFGPAADGNLRSTSLPPSSKPGT